MSTALRLLAVLTVLFKYASARQAARALYPRASPALSLRRLVRKAGLQPSSVRRRRARQNLAGEVDRSATGSPLGRMIVLPIEPDKKIGLLVWNSFLHSPNSFPHGFRV
jgi:hypothetical protein